MGIINILDPATANKIAAGEIVERPVSIVKELLENSLDAGAKYIEIEIADGGLSLVRVTDNGHGMDSKDAEVAFLRHATSKINTLEDLYNLHTFGFRGEALPSIAAVSQITLITCNDATNAGTMLKLTAGQIESKKKVASVQGTTIEIRNLFFNTPGRRKFIKNRSYEAGLITELVSKYSLGHMDVRFKLISNKEIVFDTGGLNSIESRLVEIYGSELKGKFVNVEKTELKPGINVEAWLALPNFTRNTKSQQTFFINGRLIKCKELNKVLDETYHTLIPKGRFAIAVIKLDIPSSELDVNIHPAKLEVKINNLDHLFKCLVDLFKPRLWNTSVEDLNPLLRDTLTFKENKKENIRLNEEESIVYYQKELPLPKKEETEPKEKAHTKINPLVPEETPPISEQTLTPIETYQDNKNAVIDVPKANKKIDLVSMAQLNNSFILAQDPKGLYIIDQHACHERILYEEFIKKENQKSIFSDNLLIPLSLTLTGKQEGILVENILLLKELGFIVEYFGPRSFILRAIPSGLKTVNMESFFIDLLETLTESSGLSSAKIKENIIILASCKGAVKANQKLSFREMVYLIDQLNHVENPHTCPHGRPIIYHLSMEDLYKIFRRGEYRCD